MFKMKCFQLKLTENVKFLKPKMWNSQPENKYLKGLYKIQLKQNYKQNYWVFTNNYKVIKAVFIRIPSKNMYGCSYSTFKFFEVTNLKKTIFSKKFHYNTLFCTTPSNMWKIGTICHGQSNQAF